jgi:Tfp pilus assembly protein FimT
MKTRQTNRNRGGFTFAEVIVTGTTLSVLLSVFTPKFTSAMDDLAIRNATDEFVGAGQRARAVAIHHGRTAELRIEGNRVWVEADTTRARTGERTTIGDVIDLTDSGVTLDASVTSLCFDSRGIAPTRGACAGSGGHLEFSKGNSSKTVAVMATGFMLK